MQFSARGGRFFYVSEGSQTPIPPSDNNLLLEDTDDMLLENDSLILLEA